MRSLMLAVAVAVLSLGSAPAGQQGIEIKEPLLPSDGKECEQLSSDYKSIVDRALDAKSECTSRLVERARNNLPSAPRVNQTNKACLAQLPESQREVLGFTCNEDSRCSGENTNFYNQLAKRKEATESCYARVNVYKAVEKSLKDLEKRIFRDQNEQRQQEQELSDLANFTRSRDLELNQQIEKRVADRLLKNQEVAREFHRQAMEEFYAHQTWLRDQYQTAMDQVFKVSLSNQQFAWKMAQASAKNDAGTRLALLRGAHDAFTSAYSSGGGWLCTGGDNCAQRFADGLAKDLGGRR